MKKTYYILIPAFLHILVLGCKKEEPHDQLEGDMEALVGTWKWDHTIHTVELCAPEFTYTVTLTPETQNFKYYISLKKEGVVEIYRDEQLISNYNIYVNYYETNDFGESQFRFDLNNDDENLFVGFLFLDPDTLFLHNHPFDAKDDGCISYSNYFIRQ